MIAHSKVTLTAGLFARQNVLVQYLQNFLSLVPVWIERHRSRNELAQLNAHMINDIGLSPSDVERELSKPFWVA